MFDKAPTRALVIGMMAAGMLSGCASFGDPQQHHQVERILQQKEEPVGIVFPIRLNFDEADNMTTLSVQKELTETLESDEQVTVVGFELGQILCETLDGAEDASVLDFAISPTETLRAARVSYKVFSGEAFSDGVTRKVWTGKGTEEDADGTYRTVSLSWTTECNAETFLQTVTTHGPNGSLSAVKSVPCGAGSSIDICIVEIDLDLRESGEPLMPLDTSKDNTEDSDSTLRHLGVLNLGEGGKEAVKNAGDRRNLQSSTPRIDVLILFNETSLAELGDISPVQMITILAAEVQEANDVLANSQIDLEFKLVYVQMWRVELKNMDGDYILPLFKKDEYVNGLRSSKEADLVALVTPLDGICGIGYIYSGKESGYSVTDPVCLSGRTMTHEFGHNLGCYHDRRSSATQHDYAHGLRYCSGNPMIHTTMAYRCGGVDIQYFSNPEVSYKGLPTGIANDADCARRIRETMVSVSEYSDEVVCNDNGGSANSLGNGWCNPFNNNEECLWDKGDCCESCCSHFFCGMGRNGYDCKDPKCGGDAPIPAPTPPPPSNSASGRIETTLLVEGFLLYFAVFIQLCFLSQF